MLRFLHDMAANAGARLTRVNLSEQPQLVGPALGAIVAGLEQGGALGGLRSLCFNLVGRRIMVWVRSRLYRAIIVQDIAFFDGIRTGDLTQRLSGDTRAMVGRATPRATHSAHFCAMP